MKIRKFSSIGKIVRRDINDVKYDRRQAELTRMSRGKVDSKARYEDYRNGSRYIGHFPILRDMLQDRKAESRGGYPY